MFRSVAAPDLRDPGAVNWDGTELVAFKLHLPSRIHEHNVKLLDGANGTTERGNILTWEQTLVARRAGTPIVMDVTMDVDVDPVHDALALRRRLRRRRRGAMRNCLVDHEAWQKGRCPWTKTAHFSSITRS